jgi:hypothetical protein
MRKSGAMNNNATRIAVFAAIGYVKILKYASEKLAETNSID